MKAPPCNILLVEDSQDDADLLANMMREAGIRCNLTFAGRLSEAAVLFAAQTFDIALLDLSLPDSFGIATVTSAIRQMTSPCPIIVLTGQDDEEMATQALQQGAQDYLIKGEADAGQIVRSIRYAIERHRLLHDLQKSIEERRQLEAALTNQQMRQLWEETPVTTAMAGVGPLKSRDPQAFDLLANIYGQLLDQYLTDLGYQRPLPRKEIDFLAQRIGRLSGGPRDVIDLHIQAMHNKLPGSDIRKTQNYTVEGRLFSLEVMGYLVDFYRLRGPASCSNGTTKEHRNEI